MHRFTVNLYAVLGLFPAEALVLRPLEIRNAVGDFGRLPNGLSGLGIPTAAAPRVRRLRVLRQSSQLHLVKVRRGVFCSHKSTIVHSFQKLKKIVNP